MIDKETAIELAKDAGLFGYEILGMEHDIHRLCNLAVKHAQKDAEPGTQESNPNWKCKDGKCDCPHPTTCHPAHDDTALLRQALEALGTCRIMGADADGNYTKEITPKVIQTAITALRERLGEKV